MSLIKSIRGILTAYSLVTWKTRCEIKYDGDKEKARMDQRNYKETARKFIRRLKLTGTVTIEQVLGMSTSQKLRLRGEVTRKRDQQRKQTTLDYMEYFTSEQNIQQTEQNARQRTQKQVRNSAARQTMRTQLTISNTGTLRMSSEVEPDKAIDKKPKKKQKRSNNTQVSLEEKWNIPKARVTMTTKSNAKKTHKICAHSKEYEVKDTRRVQYVTQEEHPLVECHICEVVCHVQCDMTMPVNVADRGVVWRCKGFIYQ